MQRRLTVVLLYLLYSPGCICKLVAFCIQSGLREFRRRGLTGAICMFYARFEFENGRFPFFLFVSIQLVIVNCYLESKLEYIVLLLCANFLFGCCRSPSVFQSMYILIGHKYTFLGVRLG